MAGLLRTIHRRGVTPFVTLRNISGANWWKSLMTSRLRSSVCRAETPLTAWLPTAARCAMRTYFSPDSSKRDMRRTRSSSPG